MHGNESTNMFSMLFSDLVLNWNLKKILANISSYTAIKNLPFAFVWLILVHETIKHVW